MEMHPTKKTKQGKTYCENRNRPFVLNRFKIDGKIVRISDPYR